MNIKGILYGLRTVVLVGLAIILVGFLGACQSGKTVDSVNEDVTAESVQPGNGSDDEPVLYHCPVHIHEHSTDPDAVCPIGGETMVPVPEDELEVHQHGHNDNHDDDNDDDEHHDDEHHDDNNNDHENEENDDTDDDSHAGHGH